MVTETKVKLSKAEYHAVDKEIGDKGYYIHEYFNSPRTVQTDIKCPKCGADLMFIQTGASYQIKCPTVDCINKIARGI